MPVDPLAWVSEALAQLEAAHLRRTLTSHEGPQGAYLEIEGRRWINFGANDYLGLAADPRLARAACAAIEQAGVGAGASPLVTGHTQWHRWLEQRLAEFEAAEAALVFSSGYAANVGAITALVERGDAVLSDQNNHASLIDGCRLSRAEVFVYPHADYDAVARLLRDASGFRRRLIVTDGLFSMDGDLAPLVELAELAQRHQAMLLVDEAHATGVFGDHGRGTAEALGVEEAVQVRVGTLSKALGCCGGFVVGRRDLIDWLLNRARTYVFSTAMPAATAAAALAALDIVGDQPQRRQRLLDEAARLRDQLRAAGWNTGRSQSQIVPIVVGQPQRALELAARLRAEGFWVPAIRPPTVPQGQSLLRVSLSAAHPATALDALADALGRAN
jgi:8-amino-7-oxononanoate synthase